LDVAGKSKLESIMKQFNATAMIREEYLGKNLEIQNRFTHNATMTFLVTFESFKEDSYKYTIVQKLLGTPGDCSKTCYGPNYCEALSGSYYELVFLKFSIDAALSSKTTDPKQIAIQSRYIHRITTGYCST
jgi:hypothetical protein